MRSLVQSLRSHAARSKAVSLRRQPTLGEALEHLPVGVLVCEVNRSSGLAMISYHNNELAAIFGCDSAQALLEPAALLSVVRPEDLVRLSASLTEVIRTGGECKGEFRIQRGESIRWIEFRATAYVNDSANCIMAGCCWDISPRKDVEQAATDQQDVENGRLRLQSESLPIALVISVGADLIITEWNPAAEHIFGYTREEVIGQSGLKLLLAEKDWEFVRNVTSAAPDSAQARTSIVQNVRKDGRAIWCRWVNTPIPGANGTFNATMAMAEDITEQLQNAEQVRLWASVIQQSMEAIMICDASQRIVLVNKAFENITGFTEKEAIGNTPRMLRSGRQSQEFYAQMWRSIVSTDQWRGEIWNRRKTGELYAEWLALSAVRDHLDAVSHYIGIFSDITARKEIEERVHRLAHFDALTDLPNRSLLIDRVGQLLAAARRSRKKVALLFLDLDRFKNINDSMGHEAGDELLKLIAQRLTHTLRSSDTIARMGGDEFVITLAEIDDVAPVALIAQEVLAAINAPLTLNHQELSITGSIGICMFPDDALDVGDMIRNADAAMYRAKTSGCNTYQFYTRDMNARALEILATETALRHALQDNEFVLHYQPQIDLHSGAIVGMEALIRWNRPGVGLLMPGQFISIAEERGLISAIGRWTLQEAARQAAQWDHAGVPSLPIAINLSATEFHQAGFIERVQETMVTQGLRPERIEFEITEGVIMRDTMATIDILRRLHDYGVRLSLDDFGTGYSSLNYLRRFPIDKIKIDRSFVAEMMQDRGAAGIVNGIIGLAKSLQLEVIAEGVETTEQLCALRAAHCKFAQGYLMSRPVPPPQLEKLLADWSPKTFAG